MGQKALNQTPELVRASRVKRAKRKNNQGHDQKNGNAKKQSAHYKMVLEKFELLARNTKNARR